ncbi:TIGR00289 family protein [Candidatus Woesearchaeota archaeon CG11_big_fil_rev_8_21_14_0_20_43_8]|nr:MAG: TIGR00289 family protein [Candidatus Woesearchaeota archaeon CG11_big_fil_rev_8_21_14_0_20_43_8]PIO04676.1 MAG: TIGR00289 family protein [Candidatus Woesearchaeota archaeon CG08_land_8_20_14_0_20_43_7]
MRLAALFSGGKDSIYAAYLAMQKAEVVCLVTLVPENKESYMFHTPNIGWTELQAEAIGIPHLIHHTKGEKEKELDDLKDAIIKAKEKYQIDGIVTGAIESVYQAARIQRICHELGLWCFNPLWKREQVGFLRELNEKGFKAVISGVFAYPFDESWLGKMIDEDAIKELADLQKRYKINPSGEGGEIETFVVDGPVFKKKIEILRSKKTYDNYNGLFIIEEAELR